MHNYKIREHPQVKLSCTLKYNSARQAAHIKSNGMLHMPKVVQQDKKQPDRRGTFGVMPKKEKSTQVPPIDSAGIYQLSESAVRR